MTNYSEKYKPTSLSAMKDRKNEVATATNQFENEDGNGRIRKKTISDDGLYKLRMYPAHPGEKSTAVEPKVITLIPGWKNKKDSSGKWIEDGKGGFEKELGIRPVWNSKVHGGAPLDLIDTYITLAKQKGAEKFKDESKLKEFLAPIDGNKFEGGIHMGINPIRTFLIYADLYDENNVGVFHEIEIKPSVQKQMQKLAAIESGDDPLGTDACFTDIEDGKQFRIKVDGAESKRLKDPSLWYTVSLINDTEKITGADGRPMHVLKTYPLSEEQLIAFDAVEPLSKYRTIFSHKDLQIQLEGLQLFDKQYGYGVIELQEFKEVYLQLTKLFPVPEDDATNDNDDSQESQASSSNSDHFDLMDRKELIQYIKENRLGVTVLPKYTEEDLREIIREIEKQEEETDTDNYSDEVDAESTKVETQYEDVESEQEEPQTPVSGGLSSRLAALRGKLAE